MTEMTDVKKDWKVTINPYVSNLASKLMKNAVNADMKLDSKGWQLISEVLSFAAAAEQRMTDQMDRISYLEHLSTTDELTGISNRRGLRNFLGNALAAAARHNEKGVLGFLDLDGFKKINDTHGHLAGDSILRHVAKVISEEIRTTDHVARVSGDEFAIVMTRCTQHEGIERLSQIQKTLDNSKVKFGRKTIPVKCSVGIHPFEAATDPTELIDLADKAMYNDKQTRKAGNDDAPVAINDKAMTQ